MEKRDECFERLQAVLREYDDLVAMEAGVMLVAHVVSNIAGGYGWLSETERQQVADELKSNVAGVLENYTLELKRRKETGN